LRSLTHRFEKTDPFDDVSEFWARCETAQSLVLGFRRGAQKCAHRGVLKCGHFQIARASRFEK
jgi:hypothetical protein